MAIGEQSWEWNRNKRENRGGQAKDRVQKG